jgi:hypothetical protein
VTADAAARYARAAQLCKWSVLVSGLLVAGGYLLFQFGRHLLRPVGPGSLRTLVAACIVLVSVFVFVNSCALWMGWHALATGDRRQFWVMKVLAVALILVNAVGIPVVVARFFWSMPGWTPLWVALLTPVLAQSLVFAWLAWRAWAGGRAAGMATLDSTHRHV